jgi:nucleoside diphosphate kinase
VAILVVVNKEESYIDSNGIRTIYKTPIIRLKDLVGNKDPTTAKTTNPNSLRALFGIDLIKNELWSSDTPSDAFRELSSFKLTLPAKVNYTFL